MIVAGEGLFCNDIFEFYIVYFWLYGGWSTK